MCTQTAALRPRLAVMLGCLPPFLNQGPVLRMLQGSPHTAEFPDEASPSHLTPQQCCALISGIVALVDPVTFEPLSEEDILHDTRRTVVTVFYDIMAVIREQWVPYCAEIRRQREAAAAAEEAGGEVVEEEEE